MPTCFESWILNLESWILDSCLQCTNGTTGLVEDYLVDCAGTCNKSRIDNCGFCQVYGFDTETDCNGDCFGDAMINECKVCVRGKTNKTKEYGKTHHDYH